jgi:hypothetical protein
MKRVALLLFVAWGLIPTALAQDPPVTTQTGLEPERFVILESPPHSPFYISIELDDDGAAKQPFTIYVHGTGEILISGQRMRFERGRLQSIKPVTKEHANAKSEGECSVLATNPVQMSQEKIQ